MPGRTAICNIALNLIGETNFLLNLDENNERARICRTVYGAARDEVMAARPWNFAMARASLPRLSTTPAYEYEHEYQLPADCLRVWEAEKTAGVEPRWVREADRLLTDEEAVNVRYIRRVEDEGKFPPEFVTALACRLAAQLAMSLANSRTKFEAMMLLYRDALSEGGRLNAQEGNPDTSTPDSPWLREGR